ncbi:MAG: glycoside hydrolase family 3 C-terminal domain-containing protein [Proteobacteria bacterium]|nr:glycoside hydrolase family 3 C-terminal domain-containing protein [Pseudomonadota bacterium]MDA1351565.1 glycoside hydrolase family 3 C-terminal domain-containing protein [Pseudomonadota bacterium]
MKKFFKYTGIAFLAVLAVTALWVINLLIQPYDNIRIYWSLGAEPEVLITDDFTYRDLNKNQQLDIYEDVRQPAAMRVEDLLSQMTLEEKAGQMMHPAITIKPDLALLAFHFAMGRVDIDAAEVFDKHISHFNFYGKPTPLEIAEKLNELQKIAARTRLGIPLTISSDPLHEAASGGIAAFSVKGFSGWPSQLGFAASRDIDLVKRFGEIAAAEYRAVGLRTALHPMADLATEPRWPRNFGTFGSNAELSAQLTSAYMLGFQGASLGPESVMTMVKHFPGGGPQELGLDPHLPSGKRQIYPGDNFDYHVKPFKMAIDNGLRVIMPYYGIPIDQTDENVAMGFNKAILTDLLRDDLGFTGVVCTDWGIVSSRAWGVEGLSVRERYKKSIDAGVDQYGGESDPEHIVDLVNTGELGMERINQSVRRLLLNKFELGLFEAALVDEQAIPVLVKTPEYVAAGLKAQRKSIVLLNNKMADALALPITRDTKIFVDGLDPEQAKALGQVVNSAEQADVIIFYLPTIFNGNQDPGSDKFIDKLLSSILPDSNLAFNAEVLNKAQAYSEIATLITVVDLNRPAILTELNQLSHGLIGTFGVYDSVLFEMIFGQFSPQGKLPFEIPSSMSAVRAQQEDMPDDSVGPTFTFGHGLSY